MPALTRIERSPEQPSVNAVSLVSVVWPTSLRPRWISASIDVSVFATAAKTCRPPSDVSTLPRRTSRCRWPSSQLRMKVESRDRVIDEAAVAGLVAAVSTRSAPTLSVQARRVSGSLPASIGRRYSSTAGSDPVGHAGGKLRPDLVEFGRRAAMCWPAVPSLPAAATGTAEAGQSQRDLTEQGGDLMGAVILDLARGSAGATQRPPWSRL